VSSFDLTSPVVLELRAARPRAPEALRERVLALPEPQARFSLPSVRWRRVALVAVPACLAIAVGAALIHGAFHTSSSPGLSATATVQEKVPGPSHAPGPLGVRQKVLSDRTGAPAHQYAPGMPAAIRPNPSRLQDYRASLTVRVRDIDALSSATQQAMRTTRALGGYVVTTRFDARKEGGAFLVVRVPITKVQQTIARFSNLGTIVAQNISIADLTNRVDTLGNQIDRLRVRIAKIDDRLAGSLTQAQRVQLELQRARLARNLHRLVGLRATLVRRAHFSRVSLTLTTHATTAASPHHRGSVGNALHDAGTILAKEAAVALYILIVAGPLLLLATLIWIAVRSGRRYADRRLLETS
jgi:uncharacterized protein DUF4349